MAATDKPFRDQTTLDIVFAVSNILMLLSIVWMFWQDYDREYKDEQRTSARWKSRSRSSRRWIRFPIEGEFDKALEKVKTKRKRPREARRRS